MSNRRLLLQLALLLPLMLLVTGCGREVVRVDAASPPGGQPVPATQPGTTAQEPGGIKVTAGEPTREVPPPGAAPVAPPPPPPGEGDEQVQVLLDSRGLSHRPACGEGWYLTDVEAGETRARQEGLPLLIIFEGDDCKHCRRFNYEYLKDAELVELVRDPSLVIVKKIHNEWERRSYGILHTPLFLAYDYQSGEKVLTEYMPGLPELELLKKRIRDISRGRGRLARLQASLLEDPQDLETLKTLVEEYRPALSPALRVSYCRRALQLEPEWTRGVALYLSTLHELVQDGVASAQPRLDTYMEEPRARIVKGLGTALDHFSLGYLQLLERDFAGGVTNLRRSAELGTEDAEVHCHLAWGLAWVAGGLQRGGDSAGARRSLEEAYAEVYRAMALAPDSALPAQRKEWLDEQWVKALGLSLETAPQPSPGTPPGKDQ